MFPRILLLSATLLVTAPSFATDANWHFPVENLDPTASPAQHFYDYATSGWRSAHPIPPDRDRWGVFDMLQEKAEDRIRQILEEASRARAPEGSDLQKIGDFYASGMDVAAIEAAGTQPIADEIDRIGAVHDLETLQVEIAHAQEIGVDAAFAFGQMQDPLEATQVIGVADQGGLGLPDRSYYLATDEQARALRAEYVAHIAKMLELAGEASDDAHADADAAMRIESSLADASMSRVERRNPHATLHVMGRDLLAAATPHFSWPRYFALVEHPEIDRINVTAPIFFTELDHLLSALPLGDWRGYLRWRLVDSTAPYLTTAFVDERFRFRSKLTGTPEQAPRWRRVLHAEDEALGFAVGKIYVNRYFSSDQRARVTAVLRNVQSALQASLATTSWMSPETRGRAQEKLSRMADRIGYPEVWLDYGKLTIDRGPYVLNVLRARTFETRRELDKIGRPVNREEWEMTPQTVNAYYDPSLNQIVFPAGILEPPFFDQGAPAAWNYGAVGTVMGHEISHGFDDQGAQYDAQGNLRNWWTEADYALFLARTTCITEQYGKYTVAGGERINGLLVTGEATADLGGVTLALRALKASPEGQAEAGQSVDGFSSDQLFFLGFASIWASNTRPEAERQRALLDPHPPPRYRVNGTVSNVPEFQAAFSVPAGSPMVNEPRCQVWE